MGVSEDGPERPALRALGMLGGTFDPIHFGHLARAREARSELELEQVLFVPNGDPPHKRDQVVTPAQHREAMVALAIETEPAFVLWRVELERPGPSYAVDSVTELADRSRAEGRPEPWFVLSAEALAGFQSWRAPERILQQCRLAVAPRPGAESIDRDWVATHFAGSEDRFAFLPGPELDITSTAIREKTSRGLPIDELVPEAVARYIQAHGLYRDLPR